MATKHTKHVDLLTDGQMGAGGFIRVIGEDGSIVEDIDSQDAENALTEADDMEPFIALVRAACEKHGTNLVRDGGTQCDMEGDDGEPMTFQAWEKMVRDHY